MIRHPNRMRPFPAFLHLSLSNTSTRAHSVSGNLPSRCVSPALTASVFIFVQELMGLPGFSNVSLPTCHGLRTPPDLLHPCQWRMHLVLPSVNVKTLGIWIEHFEAVPALQGTRLPLRPIGFSVYAYLTSRSRIASLLIEINTRYGWAANPCPTGTCTPQDTLSFAQRDNIAFSCSCG